MGKTKEYHLKFTEKDIFIKLKERTIAVEYKPGLQINSISMDEEIGDDLEEPHDINDF